MANKGQHYQKVVDGFRPIEQGDLRQLAGLLEGEGWFGWIKRRNMPGLAVTMTDEDVVQRAADLMQVGVTQGKPRYSGCKSTFSASPTGWRAMALMIELFPHLGARRRERITQVLDRWEHQAERLV